MTIETLGDWNTRLEQCGCCEMPVCFQPEKECQKNWVTYAPAYADGYAISGKWKTADWECYNSASNTFPTGTANFRGFDRVSNPCGLIGISGLDPARSAGVAEGCTDDFEWLDGTGSNPWDVSVFIEDISADAETYLSFPPTCSGGAGCYSELSAGETGGSATKSRFRWKIPNEHLGTYFKITWNILNEPTGWNTTSPVRSYYHEPEEPEDFTYEWTGAAGGGTDRHSGWYEIPVPDFIGQRRVVNIRYECYRSKFGTKPQVTGEAVTLPDT